MRYLCLPLLALLTAAAPPVRQAPPEADLVIVVTGLRSGEGNLNVALFDGPEGFPGEDGRAVHRASVALRGEPIPASGLEIRVPGLAPGSYAAIALHDENGNMRVDRNLLGIPREGYGASNGARGRFGPPEFAAARFEIGASSVRIEVPVRY